MKWDKENLDELRAHLAKCDILAEKMHAAEDSGEIGDIGPATLAYESEMDWLAVPAANFVRDVLRAFDLMDERGLLLDCYEQRGLPWSVTNATGDMIVSRCGSPLEALLAAAEVLTKETGHGD